MANPETPAVEMVSSHYYDYQPSQYVYTFNQGYFDPINDPGTVRSSSENASKATEISLDADNLRPKFGKTWEDVVQCQREHKYGPKTRLIYATRHGRTGHNEAQEHFGKAIYYKYLAFDDEYLDPGLSDIGVAQAKAAGNKARYLLERWSTDALEHALVDGSLWSVGVCTAHRPATARPAARPENRHPPRNVPSSER